MKIADGAIDGTTIRCPSHHSAFIIQTGEVVNGPAHKPVPSYLITEEMGDLHIEVV